MKKIQNFSCLQETMLCITFYKIGLFYKFNGTNPVINNISRNEGCSAIIIKTNICHTLVALQTALQTIGV